jgi:hypothetical protein
MRGTDRGARATLVDGCRDTGLFLYAAIRGGTRNRWLLQCKRTSGCSPHLPTVCRGLIGRSSVPLDVIASGAKQSSPGTSFRARRSNPSPVVIPDGAKRRSGISKLLCEIPRRAISGTTSADTDMHPPSRDIMRPSCDRVVRPSEGAGDPQREGAGNAGCPLHPQPRV